VALEDSISPGTPTVQVIQAAQQQSFSRSDVATTRRAVQDLKDQTQKLSSAILQIAATSPNCDMEEFKTAWEQRKKLNQAQHELRSLEERIGSLLPRASTARLTNSERKQIQGLYSSGLYTQGQLADQYGVTQPAISDITKSMKS
jgi:two-component SAPR family response regulator